MAIRMFVYGTLKSGFRHANQLRGVRLGTVRTAPGFFLVRYDYYPALSYEATNSRVVGELVEVDERELAHLDVFEDMPDEYQRASIRLEDGSWAQAYLMQPQAVRGCDRVGVGNWLLDYDV